MPVVKCLSKAATIARLEKDCNPPRAECTLARQIRLVYCQRNVMRTNSYSRRSGKSATDACSFPRWLVMETCCIRGTPIGQPLAIALLHGVYTGCRKRFLNPVTKHVLG